MDASTMKLEMLRMATHKNSGRTSSTPPSLCMHEEQMYESTYQCCLYVRARAQLLCHPGHRSRLAGGFSECIHNLLTRFDGDGENTRTSPNPQNTSLRKSSPTKIDGPVVPICLVRKPGLSQWSALDVVFTKLRSDHSVSAIMGTRA